MSNEILTIGKRKTATARAVTRKGNGKVLINGKPVELYPIELLRNKLVEPLKILGDRANEIDIEIKISGGGNTGQTDAARTAMAKGIVKYFSDDQELENNIRTYDRTMLVNDIRRKMPKKPMGSGARAKRQKSYR
ncbi:MAG: 30S ribosomal protein S9 [Candidatus Thermoplasmatota archaeon]|jgi:small subunit ribosomal protein S9|uniref:30S ribosomal protein S9 n=1 Tax=Ferroplasma sp. TaxID=2591003 RepID=UPI0026039051|nr:30S ribosomal protein S9 [Ferroplasma sp.]MCL4310888.1 30S ribosomal protein S9 [Candidatus Thermoplasmatota archaeon]